MLAAIAAEDRINDYCVFFQSLFVAFIGLPLFAYSIQHKSINQNDISFCRRTKEKKVATKNLGAWSFVKGDILIRFLLSDCEHFNDSILERQFHLCSIIFHCEFIYLMIITNYSVTHTPIDSMLTDPVFFFSQMVIIYLQFMDPGRKCNPINVTEL